MIREKEKHVMFIKTTNKTLRPAGPGRQNLTPLPGALQPTHVVTAAPQLAEFSFGSAQLGLKVQDFVLGCSLLGDCMLLGLFHLPRRHNGDAAYLTSRTPSKEKAGPLRTIGSPRQHQHIATETSLELNRETTSATSFPCPFPIPMSHHLRCGRPVWVPGRQ